MNINQLETLLTISKTMSFRKAGEILNLTQPAVSAQIKNLEDEFNTLLVDRNQPVKLTDRGQVFLSHAIMILDIVDELRQKLTDMNETPQGHIVLGTTASIAVHTLPHVLAYFQNQYPQIKTRIQTMTSSQVFTAVENGTVDVGITYYDEHHANIESDVLYYDSFELVVSPEHELAHHTNGVVTLADILGYPMIMMTPDTLGRRFVDEALRKQSLTPNIIMELSSSEEVKRMVEINLGIAVVSHMSVLKELSQGSLVSVPVEGVGGIHPVSLIYRRGRYLSSAMQKFLKDLKSMTEEDFAEQIRDDI
jgi:DNA-binding transcriptional LysR family regulator